jgi:hypothetical protein
VDPELKYLTTLPIDRCKTMKILLKQEVWCQKNVRVHQLGLYKRNDLATVSRIRRKKTRA